MQQNWQLIWILANCILLSCQEKKDAAQIIPDPDAGKERYDATIEFSWEQPIENINFKLIRRPNASIVAQGSHNSSDEPLILSAAIAADTSYWMDLWVDEDENGACQNPVSDPGFRIQIPSGAKAFTITHPWHQGFVDTCLTPTEPVGTKVIINGTIQLATTAQETSKFKREKPISKSVVFALGVPSITTETDEDGHFTLETVLPANLAPSANTLAIVAYYSFYSKEEERHLLLSSTAKYAGLFDVPLDSTNLSAPLDAGILTLHHTRRLNLTLQTSDAQPRTGCWVTLLDFGHHVYSSESDKELGKYEIDEMPVGSHRLGIVCADTPQKTFSYEIRYANQFSIFDSTTLTLD